MKIAGLPPLTEKERAALERPVSTDRWYDRMTRSWVVQTLNGTGDQIGDATYVHHKADAILNQKSRQAEIDALDDEEAEDGRGDEDEKDYDRLREDLEERRRLEKESPSIDD